MVLYYRMLLSKIALPCPVLISFSGLLDLLSTELACHGWLSRELASCLLAGGLLSTELVSCRPLGTAVLKWPTPHLGAYLHVGKLLSHGLRHPSDVGTLMLAGVVSRSYPYSFGSW